MKRRNLYEHLRANMLCPCCGEERHVELETSLLSMREQFDSESACNDEWAVDAAIKGRVRWACNRCLAQGKAIAAHPAAQNPGSSRDGYPYLAYYNLARRCSDCGVDFTFSAQEQRYWYEVLKFPVQVIANRCSDCRRQRRTHADNQRAIQRLQSTLDEHDPRQLYQLASLFLLSGAYRGAYEYLAQARQRAKERGELRLLQEQFDALKTQIKTAEVEGMF